MKTLHLLSHSPFTDQRLTSCLHVIGADDGLLLTGDAVLALQPGSLQRKALELMPAGVQLFALEEDLIARHLQDCLPERVNSVDYPRFVALSLQADKVNSWL